MLVTSKHFSIYPITLHLYMDEYTLLKKYFDSVCLAGVFIIKLTVTNTLFLRKLFYTKEFYVQKKIIVKTFLYYKVFIRVMRIWGRSINKK